MCVMDTQEISKGIEKASKKGEWNRIKGGNEAEMMRERCDWHVVFCECSDLDPMTFLQ